MAEKQKASDGQSRAKRKPKADQKPKPTNDDTAPSLHSRARRGRR
jgi:hypothetical protein